MTLNLGTFTAIYLAPLILTATYYIRRLNRGMVEAERLPLPFEPRPITAPTGIFRTLTPPQRMYLTQQLKTALVIYLLLAWTELFILSMPYLVAFGDSVAWLNPAARTWFLFVTNAARSGTFFTVFLNFCAFAAIIPIRIGAQAMFHRTRPISLGFLFWARILSILVALCAAMITGITLALALLAAIKGPVWHSLPTDISRVINPQETGLTHLYASLLVTSTLRLFLSLITTMMLFFSVLVAVFTIPSQRFATRANAPLLVAPFFLFAILSPIFLISFDNMQWLHLPRILFLYSHLGAPPPYVFALGPIAVSAAFLSLARFFIRRLEF